MPPTTALTASPGSTPAAAPAVAAPPPPTPPQQLGPSLALEAVSQAAAMAVQDAGTYFRQVAAVSAAAVAVFTAKMVETQSPDPWSSLIEKVGDNLTKASGLIKTVASDAAAAVKSFTPT